MRDVLIHEDQPARTRPDEDPRASFGVEEELRGIGMSSD